MPALIDQSMALSRLGEMAITEKGGEARRMSLAGSREGGL